MGRSRDGHKLNVQIDEATRTAVAALMASRSIRSVDETLRRALRLDAEMGGGDLAPPGKAVATACVRLTPILADHLRARKAEGASMRSVVARAVRRLASVPQRPAVTPGKGGGPSRAPVGEVAVTLDVDGLALSVIGRLVGDGGADAFERVIRRAVRDHAMPPFPPPCGSPFARLHVRLPGPLHATIATMADDQGTSVQGMIMGSLGRLDAVRRMT